jgi:alcohol dehydrogenase (quinone), cytochrome c subunit
MALWNTLYFDAGAFAADPRQSDAWNRGSYLVEALGHCSACHTPRGLLLAERADAHLSGGEHIDEVEAGKFRLWSAPNLSAAARGLARWSADDLARYLKNGHNRWTGTFGPMNEVIGNSLRYLTDADLAAMAVYIKALPARGEAAAAVLNDAERAAGQTLYDRHCRECHLASGRGGFRKAPAVAGSAIVQAPGAASLINIILYGAHPAAELPATLYTWEDMPAFGSTLSDVEVSQLVNLLRVSWGNRGERITPPIVTAQR